MKENRPRATSEQIDRARELRRDATFPERLLWGRLRASRLCGLKFRRQHPIGPFVADFFCSEHRLVIELDGNSHDGRAEQDARRSEYLRQEGLGVVRFGNDDVLRDLEAVLKAILLACGVDLNAPSPRPLPEGEGDRVSTIFS